MTTARFVVGFIASLLLAANGIAAATNSGAMASAPLRPPEIQILKIDVPPPVPPSGLSRDQQKEWEKKRKEREKERQRLAVERSGQQELAKKQIEETAARAQRDDPSSRVAPEVKFERGMDLVDQALAEGKFSRAAEILARVKKEQPAGLPTPDRLYSLEARVKAQSTPVEVNLKSDGETYVSIANLLRPQKLYTAKVKLMPGDYELKGQRRDRSDVTIKLRVRNGEPLPRVISVVAK